MQGVVKRFNKTKGFGFITCDDGQDAFFLYSVLVMDGFNTIEAISKIEFDLVEGERCLQAHKK